MKIFDFLPSDPAQRTGAFVIIALVLGALVGMALYVLAPSQSQGDGSASSWLLYGDFGLLGLMDRFSNLFLASLRMVIIPLVFSSLVVGVCALSGPQMGRLGFKTLAWYLGTTFFAVTFALCIATLIDPGRGFPLDSGAAQWKQPELRSIASIIDQLIPSNPIRAFAEGNVLQVIVFALFVGYAINLVGKPAQPVVKLMESVTDIMVQLVMLIMKVVPIAVFFLIARVFARQGPEVFGSLAAYFFTVVFTLLIHASIVYPVILRVVAGLAPLTFVRKFWPVQTIAFSTSSSSATMPVTLTTVQKSLGVRKDVASFIIPLGATINMDGTIIMQGVATVFIASAFGVDLGLSGYLGVIFTAALASIGTAGVPGAGLIMLALVLTQAGLPLEGIGIVLAVDRLLDMLRTAVNVTGDATICCAIASQEEGALDREIFDSEKKIVT